MKKETTYEQEAMKAIRLEQFKGVFLGFVSGMFIFHIVAFLYGIIWLVILSLNEGNGGLWGQLFEIPHILFIGVLSLPFGYGLHIVQDKMGFSMEENQTSVIFFYIAIFVRIVIGVLIQYL